MSKKKRALPQTVGLNCPGVETHAHLDIESFPDELDEVIQRARECSIAKIGNVFLGISGYEENKHLFENYPEVFFILGVHPNEAESFTDRELEAIGEACRSDSRIKAIGEIGLDFYWSEVSQTAQYHAFRAQLSLAKELGLPVVIHSRDANEQSIRTLEEEGFSGLPLLWHCFGADTETAKRIIDNGWYISIPGTITYRKNELPQEAVKTIPLDRLVLETDSPFLAPEPWRGKRNEPAYVAFTARKVAELRGMDVNELWAACGENANRFFKL
ncbi:TatD family hydrolase [Maridesulfovibrio bastinii]|uniref:TatD family hydrolase n=1 Tax=Maridesulfovibrio bastinii TaxID=47157 RepID=UPI000428A64B|nr:TatD family hydrolase [Maridesulfovibrio bastinii]